VKGIIENVAAFEILDVDRNIRHRCHQFDRSSKARALDKKFVLKAERVESRHERIIPNDAITLQDVDEDSLYL
jgi:hypothetical protein